MVPSRMTATSQQTLFQVVLLRKQPMIVTHMVVNALVVAKCVWHAIVGARDGHLSRYKIATG